MKTLIVHPTDHSTEFLTPIYKNIVNKTVITGGVSKSTIIKQINTHETIILLGHGSEYGLLAVNQFPGSGAYIIDNTMVPFLKQKSKIISIWCHANQFVRYHKLKGFYTGMFISEISEAEFYGLWGMTQDIIDESNNLFAQILNKYINDKKEEICSNVKKEYGWLASTNKVAEFNFNRLFYS